MVSATRYVKQGPDTDDIIEHMHVIGFHWKKEIPFACCAEACGVACCAIYMVDFSEVS